MAHIRQEVAEPIRLPRSLPADWDATATLVAEGRYEVGFAGERRVRFFGRDLWLVGFEVVQPGPRQGLLLAMWLNIPGGRARMSSSMARAWVIATGERPPPDLRRRRPSSYLAGCYFEAHVRTVSKDLDGVERPEAASYSRIAHLRRLTAGCSRANRSLSDTGSASTSTSES